ncbi:hypothetical protein AMAG_14411 [Allomyces macrogynus ATCC 38327]|uniref:CHASE domain-containing protein n=1 Tax=Allomyces macrogynus (strain ATCC 38327) TaxID=578462 RepID=A0A0L0T6F0_ALLM3|nr:hypothetical protein AMAG_14411 [Allomyces macrogynus ATCC 38327]|eukprot:KNE70261.1 hypothetical protein AMAG_14411 [Allomyces macrogynus ATCC 38327]
MPNNLAMQRHIPALAVAAMATGAAVAVCLWLMLRSSPSVTEAAAFCRERAALVTLVAKSEVLGVVNSLNAFVSTAPAVSAALVQKYLTKIKPNPSTVYTINFYDHIPADRRADWEAIYNTTLFSSDASLNMSPRAYDPDGYWPVVYAEGSRIRFPHGLPRSFVGFDPSGEPTRNAAVQEAASMPSHPTLSPPVYMVGNDGSKAVLAFLVYMVTKNRAVTPGNFSLANMVSVGLSVQDLFSGLSTSQYALHLRDGNTVLLDPPKSEQPSLVASRAATATIPLANRRWLLTCTPHATFGATTYLYGSWLAALSALLLGGIVAGTLAALHGLFGRHRKAQRTWECKMRALQERAEAYLQAIPSPLIMLDSAGQVLGLNEYARNLFATRDRQVDVRRVIEVVVDPDADPFGDDKQPEGSTKNVRRRSIVAGQLSLRSGDKSAIGSGGGGKPPSSLVSLTPSSSSDESRRLVVPAHGPLFDPGVSSVRVRRADGTVYPADLCASDLVLLDSNSSTTTTDRASHAAASNDTSPTSSSQLLTSDTATTLAHSPTSASPVAVTPARPGVAQVLLLTDMTERYERQRALAEATAALKRAYEDQGSMMLWLCHELRNPLAALSPAVDASGEVADAVATMLGTIQDAGILLGAHEVGLDAAGSDAANAAAVTLADVVSDVVIAHRTVADSKNVAVTVSGGRIGIQIPPRARRATAHLLRHLVSLAVAAAAPRTNVQVQVGTATVAVATPVVHSERAVAMAIGPREAAADGEADVQRYDDATSLLDLHALAMDRAVAAVPGASWRRGGRGDDRIGEVWWEVTLDFPDVVPDMFPFAAAHARPRHASAPVLPVTVGTGKTSLAETR